MSFTDFDPNELDTGDDSGEFNPDDYESSAPKRTNVEVRKLRQMHKDAREAKQLRQQVAELQRNQVFIDAGIPADGAGAWFRKGYDGELTVDAVRAAFQGALPGGGTPQPDAQQQARQQALAGHQAAADMGSGGGNADQSGLNSFLQQQMDEARQRTDWRGGARKENVALNQALAREGVSPQVTGHDWQLPGQLVSG